MDRWVDSNIDTEYWDEESKAYQDLRKQWTGALLDATKQAFNEAGYSVDIVTHEKAKTHRESGIYQCKHVTLFLDEADTCVKHIRDG